jgi:hypothetical protein
MTMPPRPSAEPTQAEFIAMQRGQRHPFTLLQRHFQFLRQMVASQGMGPQPSQQAAMLVALERYRRRKKL